MRLERIPGSTSAGRALRFLPFFTPFARFFAVFENRILIRILGSQNPFSGDFGDNDPKSRAKQGLIWETKKKEVLFYERNQSEDFGIFETGNSGANEAVLQENRLFEEVKELNGSIKLDDAIKWQA